MRWLLSLALTVTAVGVLIVVVLGRNDPDRYMGVPLAAGEGELAGGRLVIARGRYSDGERYVLWAKRDGRTSLCMGFEIGISGCGPVPSRAQPLDISVDPSSCRDTVLYGQAVAPTRRVEVVLAKGRVIDAHLFELPSELGHEAVVFAAQARGAVDVRSVRALDERGDTIATLAQQRGGLVNHESDC